MVCTMRFFYALQYLVGRVRFDLHQRLAVFHRVDFTRALAAARRMFAALRRCAVHGGRFYGVGLDLDQSATVEDYC